MASARGVREMEWRVASMQREWEAEREEWDRALKAKEQEAADEAET